jgi:DNA topoisomerase-2
VRFILGVVRGEIIVNNRKRADLLADLKAKGFTPFPKKSKSLDPPVVGADPVPAEGEDTSEQVNSDLTNFINLHTGCMIKTCSLK